MIGSLTFFTSEVFVSEEVINFFDEVSQDFVGAADASYEKSSEQEEKRVALDTPGKYVLKVKTFAFKKDDKIIQSPKLSITAKGSLMLEVNFANECETQHVPVGANIWINLVLFPGKEGRTKDKIEKTMSMLKPRLFALLGSSDGVKITDMDWISNNLIAKFEIVGDEIKLIQDHQMKKSVYVTLEREWYNNKPKLKVISFVAAQPGDKSESYPDEANKKSGGPSIPRDEDLNQISSNTIEEDFKSSIGVSDDDIPSADDVVSVDEF
jgi:hypothetical protein